MLSQGEAFLDAQRHEHMTRGVQYKRASDGSTVSLDATVGRTEFEQVDRFGISQRTETRDYIVRTGDLVFGGQTATPLPGDVIVETLQSESVTFEVSAIGDEPPFRFTGADRLSIRIHTKRVSINVGGQA